MIRKFVEAAAIMLVTVGAAGALLAALACILFPVSWQLAAAVWLVTWILFTVDFHLAEQEKARKREVGSTQEQ